MKTSIKALVLGALVGASALTGVLPALASTTSSSAVRVTVSPGTTLVKTGAHHFSEVVRVSNGGSVPVLLKSRVLELGHGASGSTCQLTQAPAWSSLKVLSHHGSYLAPHETWTFKFSLDAPASATGVRDVAAVFTALPTSAKPGAAQFAGSVGSRVVLRLTGHAVKAPVCGTPGHAQAASHGSGPVSAPLVIGLAALLAMGSAVIVWWTRRRRHSTS